MSQSSNKVKRQRKRRRIDQDGDPEFQVAPMVDVLLVLMLFFMAITSTEVLKKNKDLQLADAKHAKPNASKQNHSDEVTVNVDWDGINSKALFSMNGVDYATPDAMVGALMAQVKQNPASFVVIRADRNTEFTNISDMMTACSSAGISTVSFAVLLGAGNNHKTPAPGAETK
jgi:biopolymer transport protein ExbD